MPELIRDRLRTIADAPLYIPDAPTLAEAAAEALAEQMEIGEELADRGKQNED